MSNRNRNFAGARIALLVVLLVGLTGVTPAAAGGGLSESGNSSLSIHIQTPPYPVHISSGESKRVSLSISDVGNISGTITNRTYQFFTQYDVPLSEPFGPFPTGIEIDTVGTASWNELVYLPKAVADQARSIKDYAIVLKTTFGGSLQSGERFTANSSLLLLLPPDNFSKVSPADGALVPSNGQSLLWNSSVGAVDYEYCFDTINNSSCDTNWTGTYDTFAALQNLPTGTTFYWQVRANNTTGTTYANNGDWWEFTTVNYQAGTTILASVDSNEAQAYRSDQAAISDGGRYVVFRTYAALVEGDVNGASDIFMRDTLTGTTTIVSVSSDELFADGDSFNPYISPDGRYVVFESIANNLVTGPQNSNWDIFIRDTVAGTTRLVSVPRSGMQLGGPSYEPSISSDGRYVAFYSPADLVSGDTNGQWDVFVRDMVMNTTEIVSVSSSEEPANSFSQAPSISPDGRYVAFMSDASNLVSGDSGNNQDIFLRDLQAGTTIRISVDSGENEANAISSAPSVSNDGHYVAFSSWASNLTFGDTNLVPDVFIRDVWTGTTTRVSIHTNGTQGNQASEEPTISADGRFITFTSRSTNLVNGDTNNEPDIFMRDTHTANTTLVSVDSSGVQGNLGSWGPAISSDATSVAFTSWSTNLVAGDSNESYDVFVHYLSNTPPPANTTFYVKWDAIGANNGTSWANAYRDLQSAFSAASAGDEIWVAAGTYRPSAGTDRTISFALKNGVAVYGGFAGTETLLIQRDLQANVTTLSGDIGAPGDNTDNSYHVVVGSGTDNSAILDGFTVAGGKGDEGTLSRGGGMYSYLGSPTVRNVTFTQNYADFGGGMFNGGEFGFEQLISRPFLANVIFQNNSATEGGGFFSENYVHATLTDVTFDGNTASRAGAGMQDRLGTIHLTNVVFKNNVSAGAAGGIQILSLDATLTNVTFSGNTAVWGAGVINAYVNSRLTNVTFEDNAAQVGGGMWNSQAGPILTNVVFTGNSAVDYGGGMYNEANGSPELKNVVFTNNSAGSGSGIFNSTSSPSLLDVTFSGNTGSAGSRGGAIVNDLGSSPSLINVTFVNNSVDFTGGGMLNSFDSNPSLVNVTFVGNSSTDRGGAIYNWDSNPNLGNVTFSGNSSAVGGAIYNDNDSNPIIVNSIMYGNNGGEIHNQVGSAIVTYSVVAGGYPGTGNLNVDPLLGPLQNNGGFTQTMALLSGSPAIDAGDDSNCPRTDQRGVTRPQGSHCDIGAYEFEGSVPTPTFTPSPTNTPTSLPPTATHTPTRTPKGAPTLTPTPFSTPSLTPQSPTVTFTPSLTFTATNVVRVPAEMNKEFSPINITAGGTSRLGVTIFNPNLFDLTSAAWLDNLPAGVTVANPVNLTNSCGGTVTAVSGGSSISLTGGTVPAQVGSSQGSCTVAVDITSSTSGNHINTIPAGALTTANGVTNANSTSATLTVMPSTSTHTPTRTPKGAPTISPTHTNTPIASTATQTVPAPPPTVTFTPLPTNTPILPTATPTFTPPSATTATFTPTSSGKRTSTPTGTPGISTATHTATPPLPTATATLTSIPTANTATLTPIPTATSGSSIFPSTGVLDTFNRANGGIGTNWGGFPTAFAIASNQLDVVAGGSNTYILWKNLSFGTDQEVHVKLTQLDAGSGNEHSLILKSQSGKSSSSGLISVRYDAMSQAVQVWTYHSTQGWVQHGAEIPVTFVSGDQFGARARPDGTVEVYRNGALIGSRSITSWPHFASGGYIGLWFVNSPNALLDDFGGGTRLP